MEGFVSACFCSAADVIGRAHCVDFKPVLWPDSHCRCLAAATPAHASSFKQGRSSPLTVPPALQGGRTQPLNIMQVSLERMTAGEP